MTRARAVAPVRDEQGDPGAVEDAHEQVASERVSTKYEQAAVRIMCQTVGEIRALHNANRLSASGEGVRVLLVRRMAGQVSGQRATEAGGKHQENEDDEG